MELKEIIELKIKTQDEIQKLIEEFVDKTELDIDDIKVKKDFYFGRGCDYRVLIDVKI